MRKKQSIVQLNNEFIQNENQRLRFEEEEISKRHRFIGFIMVIIVFLFILPTYNLMSSYVDLQEKKENVVQLKKDVEELTEQMKAKKALAEQLKNEEFILKYARAKYYYIRDGEVVYSTPELLPK
ncbi:septum formation initiator family protein [Streptococcus hillyeri]|uniref:Septum formation initiator family protein n=1 Tax=Streptococcus hillyeri TaxID=2282420 RepID=A0A3L9DTV4_9STRE|nr:septum formation initiator family protein [Streptococcus hillyeri]RLY03453.1 septum formation initiator family protein [Streptococcus hillyeri]